MVKAGKEQTYLVVDKKIVNRLYKHKIIGRTWNEVVAMLLDGYEKMDRMLDTLCVRRNDQELKKIVDETVNEWKKMKEEHLGYSI